MSISDDAFALLLIDNYLDKWKATAASKEPVVAEAVGNGANEMQQVETGAAAKKASSTAGKYTAEKSGQCKYGGWSDKGLKQFNDLRNLVREDRAANKEIEKETGDCQEKHFMNCFKSKAGLNREKQLMIDDDDLDKDSQVAARMPVEAEWDDSDGN